MEDSEERKDCEVSHCNTMGNFTNREKELVIRILGKFPNFIASEISLTIFTLHLMGYDNRLYFYYVLYNGKRITFFY